MNNRERNFLKGSLIGALTMVAASAPAFAGPASSMTSMLESLVVNDLGVVGPKGEVTLFYKDGNNIVIKECAEHTVVENRADCKLKEGAAERRVPVADFKKMLKDGLKIPNTRASFDAATQKKVDAYRTGSENGADQLEGKERDLKDKIATIEKFIAKYGAENANTAELDKLKKDLEGVESGLTPQCQIRDAIREINTRTRIGKLVDDTIGNAKFSAVVHSKDKGSLEFNLVKFYTSPACNTVEQNAAEGSSCVTSKGVVFNRVKGGWQDTNPKANGKIWYDEIKTAVNQYNSESFCTGKGQILPTKADFEMAESDGFREVFKDMSNRWFWSSTLSPGNSDFAYVLDGYSGAVYYDYYRSYDYYFDAARCASAPGVNR